jgi:hypothetical protein
MPGVVSSSTADIQDIQRRMAQIRREMHEDVRGAVQGAQNLTDWRSFVKSRPWVSIGVATALGYLAVPRRRRSEPAQVVTVVPRDSAVTPIGGSGTRSRGSARNSFAIIFSLVAPVIVRAAQSYAAQYLESWLSIHPIGPDSSRPRGPAGEATKRPVGPALPTQRFRDPGRIE